MNQPQQTHEMEVSIGDIVYLNSGSPDLTVAGATSDGLKLTCNWQDSGEVRSAVFPRACVYPATAVE